MNGMGQSLGQAEEVAKFASGQDAELLICPPFTLISRMHDLLQGTGVFVGGQDCHANASGPNTGDISAEMLADSGATHVIIGHSERRQHHDETDSQVRTKVAAAWRAGLVAIVCIGESESMRASGRTLEVVKEQISGSVPHGAASGSTVVAYEPIWSIGTGKTPSHSEIAEVHDFVRSELVKIAGKESGNEIRIIYGGSVNPKNAAEIFSIQSVDGALVGGASLQAADFLLIANCAAS